ncbi:MAG TPA: NUDIX domain-containing protein [Candidatus Paceibacterota bacterium]
MVRKTESAGGVVINARGEVLIVSQHGDSWSLPKGHIEAGEDAIAAAKREITEESGIEHLTLVKQLPSYKRFRIGRGGKGEDANELKTIHIFLFRTDDETLAPTDPDNPEARWVLPTDVADLLTHPKDKEFFNKILFELS